MRKKYQRLTEHLVGRDGRKWVTNFDEIERILGFSLPDSARAYQAWWSNQMRSQSLSWQSAAWKTEDLNLAAERVTFIFVGADGDDAGLTNEVTPLVHKLDLTIAEAKARLAATFGVDPSQIEITIKC